MDSLKEKDNPAPNPAKRPRIEVDEELMRQMIAGQAPLDSEVVRRIPEPEEENTDDPEEKTSATASVASAPTAEKTGIDSTASTVKEHSGFRRNPAGSFTVVVWVSTFVFSAVGADVFSSRAFVSSSSGSGILRTTSESKGACPAII